MPDPDASQTAGELSPASESGETAPRASRTRAVLGVVVVALVVVGAGAAVYHQRHAFVDALRNVGPAVMAGSIGLAALGTVATFFVWRTVLDGLGVSLPVGAGARVFFTSQLGKYLPGSVWPVVMQMEAGRAHGASRRTMLTGNLITIVLSCAVGLVLACVLLPLSDARALSRYWWLLLALPFLVALLHPRAIPLLLDRVFVLLRRRPMGERLDVRHTVRGSFWSVLSYLGLGLHVAVLALAVGGGGLTTVLLGVGGMALAVPAGVLFLPAPAGAGIRDVVLTLVLRAVLTSGQALAVVVASRVALVLVDLALAGIAGLARRPVIAPVTDGTH